MIFTITLAIFLGVVHWFYQSKIAPTNIAILREKLVILRFDLEAAEMSGVAESDRHALRLVREELEDHIRYIEDLGAGAAWVVWRSTKTHPEIIQEARRNIDVINRCANPEIRAIHERSVMLAAGATLSNSFLLAIYMSIPLIAFVLASFIKGSARNKLDGISAYYANRHRRIA